MSTTRKRPQDEHDYRIACEAITDTIESLGTLMYSNGLSTGAVGHLRYGLYAAIDEVTAVCDFDKADVRINRANRWREMLDGALPRQEETE